MRTETLIIVALLCALAACKKKAEPAKEATADRPKTEAKKPVKIDDDDDEGEGEEQPRAKPSEADKPVSAEGGEVAAKSDGAKACPKSLSGTDEADRVIPEGCGTIPVTSDYNIEGATLTIEGGVTLAFTSMNTMNVGYSKPAKLIVKGTAEKPVTFTTSLDKEPGAWCGVHLYKGASRSSLEGLIVEYTGGNDAAAVEIDGAEDVVMKGCTVRKTRGVGVSADSGAVFKEFSGNTFADVGKQPMHLYPRVAGSLGAGNTFPKDSVIHLFGGSVSANTTWRDPGVPFVLLEDVSIDGGEGTRADLTIEAGVTLKMDADAHIYAGYSQQGGLIVKGTRERPVTFTSLTAPEPGAWPGLKIYGHGEAVVEGAVFELGASNEDEGVLGADNGAKLTVKATTFRKNKAAVRFDDGVQIKAFEGNTFQETGVALRTSPQVLAGLGAGNTYDEAAKILLDGGAVSKTATWHAQATVVEVVGDVSVDDEAVLTVDPGVKLVFREGIGLGVGYSKTSGLKMLGTADKPIELRGVRDEPGVWRNVRLYGNARGNELAFVQMHGAGPDGAVQVDNGVDLKTDHISCAKCQAPTVQWDCGAKVTNVDPIATDGTPAAEGKPENCQ